MFRRCPGRWNHQDLQSSISSGETITRRIIPTIRLNTVVITTLSNAIQAKTSIRHVLAAYPAKTDGSPKTTADT